MTFSQCALCEVMITDDNDTKEHIIPNAIGGRKKIKGFICRACNSSSGDSWDKELAKQLNPLSLFFGIKRERGNAPSELFETTAGDRLNLNVDGSMAIEKPMYSEISSKVDDNIRINITARDINEAKRMLKGVKRKYPQVDTDNILDNLKVQSYYCPDMLKFDMSFGGQEAGRSVVKSALALAVSSGISTESCIEATNYLNNKDSEACFGYFYESDLIKCRPEGLPFHCVSIKGCNETKQVIAYIEYFGIYRVVLCLGSSYDGEYISRTYTINPMTSEELDLVVELNLTNTEIRGAYDYNKIPNGSVEEACGKVISTGMKASYEKEQNRVVDKVVQNAFENCGAKEGEMLTHEHINKITGSVWEGLEPFILHQMLQSRKQE